MSARIVVNATPDSATVAIGSTSTLSNFDNTGVLGWDWVLKDKPAGSAAVLTSQFGASPQITHDLAGSYAISLRTYHDAARTQFDDFDFEEIRVRNTFGFDWALPAAGETVQFDSERGWKTEVNRILTDIHDFILKPSALKTAAYTTGFGELVMVNLAGAAGNVTITPPTAVGAAGKRCGIKVVGAASGRQAIFDPPGAQTVDGGATLALTTDNAFAIFQSDGTNFHRVG